MGRRDVTRTITSAAAGIIAALAVRQHDDNPAAWLILGIGAACGTWCIGEAVARFLTKHFPNT